MTETYGFTVTAAGSPRDVNSPNRRGKPVLLLTGDGQQAIHGITIGVRCRLVDDEGAPLRFAAIGGVMPSPRKDVNAAEVAGERWVVLEPTDYHAPWPRELFGRQVRCEYDPEDLAAAQARLVRPLGG